MTVTVEPATRLARRLGLLDAVVIGLGSMIGAGVFAAFSPAAEAAGAGLLIGLAIAGVVAFCNAMSSAQLAAVYPQSGGTYVYGREQLSPFFGYLAGFAFVAGKLASLTAMALTFGAYVAPSAARPLGIAAVVALTAVNYLGVSKTAAVTRVIVVAVLASLAFVVAACLLAGDPDPDRLSPLWPDAGLHGVLASAGFLFFAFAGYARVATLGVLLSLLAGVSRTVFAMAADGHLPRRLAAVHEAHKVPHVAELAVGAVVAVVVAFADLRSAIGFSSVTVLAYYAIANASAFTLGSERRSWPRVVPVLGFVGCVTLALALPSRTVAIGLAVLAAGAALYALRSWRQ